MKMPIPNDWDGLTLCDYSIKWPDSALWRMILRGLLNNPSIAKFWDERTGDVSQVISNFEATEDYNLDSLECNAMNIPIGTIVPFAGSVVPASWLICDGSTLNVADYPELFGVIQWIYGGYTGDEDQFKVPDLRGRVVVGKDDAQTEFQFVGKTGGTKTHTLGVSEMPSHTHTQNAHNHTQNPHSHDLYLTNAIVLAGGTTYRRPINSVETAFSGIVGNATATNQSATATNQNTGGGGAHNNLQPYLTLNFIIYAGA